MPKKPLSHRAGLSARKVGIGALLRVELPILGLIAIILGISLLLSPDRIIGGTGIEVPLYACPLYSLVRVPCLFCGLTRSFLAMGGLDLRQAFIFHPLGPFFFIGMLGVGAAMAWSVLKRRRIGLSMDSGLKTRLIRAGAFLVVGAWLVKVVIWSQAGLL